MALLVRSHPDWHRYAEALRQPSRALRGSPPAFGRRFRGIDPVALPPSELGSFLAGAVAPIAFLWLVLGLFIQQTEIARNGDALRLQSKALRKSAEQAEIQARAIQANELHARQDTFVDLTKLVTRQLGVTAVFLYLSSQGAGVGGAPLPEHEIVARESARGHARRCVGVTAGPRCALREQSTP